jgi:hypothetical protein
VLDVGEESGWQKRRNAHEAVERMVLGNWRPNLFSARGCDKKSAVLDRKQAFSDKKLAFRGRRWVVR